MVITDAIHCVGDPDELLHEPESNILVDRVVIREDQCDFQHCLTIERHPGSAICLVEMSTGRQFRTTVKDADIIQAEKTTREYVSPLGIFTVHPPVKIQHQSLE